MLGLFSPGQPKYNDLVYDLCVWTYAAEAAFSFPSTGLKSMNSAAYQKSVARTRAFQAWEKQYQRTLCVEQFNANNGIPRHFAYTHTLIDSPSTQSPPLERGDQIH